MLQLIFVFSLFLGLVMYANKFQTKENQKIKLNLFAPGDFAEKRIFKLFEWFSGPCRAIKS